MRVASDKGGMVILYKWSHLERPSILARSDRLQQAILASKVKTPVVLYMVAISYFFNRKLIHQNLTSAAGRNIANPSISYHSSDHPRVKIIYQLTVSCIANSALFSVHY